MLSTTNNNTTFKIFVGCIPGKTQDAQIEAVFNEYSSLISIQLERRKNGKCSGYGYIELSNKKEYETVLEKKHFLEQRQLTTMPYLEKRDLIDSQLNFNKRRIVIAGLPKDLSDKELFQHFSKYGKIEKAFIVQNDSDPSLKPYGHVIFNDEVSATRAKKKPHFFKGKKVQIKTHKIDLKKKLKNLGPKGKKEASRVEVIPEEDPESLENPKKCQNTRLRRKLSGESSSSNVNFSFIEMSRTQILKDILRLSTEIHRSGFHKESNVRFNKTNSQRWADSDYLDVYQFFDQQRRMRGGMGFSLF